MTTVELPYPISANLYWRHVGFRVLISREARAYKKDVGWAWKAARGPLHTEDVAVMMVLHPKLTLSGEASKVRLDLGNCEKVVSDALNGIAWLDDKQIVDLHITLGPPVKDGGITISVKAA